MMLFSKNSIYLTQYSRYSHYVDYVCRLAYKYSMRVIIMTPPPPGRKLWNTVNESQFSIKNQYVVYKTFEINLGIQEIINLQPYVMISSA